MGKVCSGIKNAKSWQKCWLMCNLGLFFLAILVYCLCTFSLLVHGPCNGGFAFRGNQQSSFLHFIQVGLAVKQNMWKELKTCNNWNIQQNPQYLMPYSLKSHRYPCLITLVLSILDWFNQVLCNYSILVLCENKTGIMALMLPCLIFTEFRLFMPTPQNSLSWLHEKFSQQNWLIIGASALREVDLNY